MHSAPHVIVAVVSGLVQCWSNAVCCSLMTGTHQKPPHQQNAPKTALQYRHIHVHTCTYVYAYVHTYVYQLYMHIAKHGYMYVHVCLASVLFRTVLLI